MSRICITGSGVVSAIGLDKRETLASLRAGRSGIAPVRLLQTADRSFLVGEVPLSNAGMQARLGMPEDEPVSRTSLMGMLALEEALAEAGLRREDCRDIPLISGTTVGGMDRTEQYYRDFLGADRSHDAYIALHDCGASTEAIAAHFGGFRFSTTLSTACSSAANAVMLGANLLEAGLAQIVAVGGSESLSDFT